MVTWIVSLGICQWINFENQSTFVEVMIKSQVCCFFLTQCNCIVFAVCRYQSPHVSVNVVCVCTLCDCTPVYIQVWKLEVNENLSFLQKWGLFIYCLLLIWYRVIFDALILSKLRYAICVWSGFLSAKMAGQINAFLKRAFKYGFCNTVYTVGTTAVHRQWLPSPFPDCCGFVLELWWKTALCVIGVRADFLRGGCSPPPAPRLIRLCCVLWNSVPKNFWLCLWMMWGWLSC